MYSYTLWVRHLICSGNEVPYQVLAHYMREPNEARSLDDQHVWYTVCGCEGMCIASKSKEGTRENVFENHTV